MSSKGEIFAPNEEYRVFLEEIKQNIQSAQIKAALSLNRALIELYLSIGDKILLKQEQEQWGKSVIERLSKDLKTSFPHLKGFSPRNLWDMRRLSESVRGNQILRQVVAEIPWGHNLVLLNKIKNMEEREWYIRKTIEHGWSRNILTLQIEHAAHAFQPAAHYTPSMLGAWAGCSASQTQIGTIKKRGTTVTDPLSPPRMTTRSTEATR